MYNTIHILIFFLLTHVNIKTYQYFLNALSTQYPSFNKEQMSCLENLFVFLYELENIMLGNGGHGWRHTSPKMCALPFKLTQQRAGEVDKSKLFKVLSKKFLPEMIPSHGKVWFSYVELYTGKSLALHLFQWIEQILKGRSRTVKGIFHFSHVH